jgi:hypothetical protein
MWTCSTDLNKLHHDNNTTFFTLTTIHGSAGKGKKNTLFLTIILWAGYDFIHTFAVKSIK